MNKVIILFLVCMVGGMFAFSQSDLPSGYQSEPFNDDSLGITLEGFSFVSGDSCLNGVAIKKIFMLDTIIDQVFQQQGTGCHKVTKYGVEMTQCTTETGQFYLVKMDTHIVMLMSSGGCNIDSSLSQFVSKTSDKVQGDGLCCCLPFMVFPLILGLFAVSKR